MDSFTKLHIKTQVAYYRSLSDNQCKEMIGAYRWPYLRCPIHGTTLRFVRLDKQPFIKESPDHHRNSGSYRCDGPLDLDKRYSHGLSSLRKTVMEHGTKLGITLSAIAILRVNPSITVSETVSELAEFLPGVPYWKITNLRRTYAPLIRPEDTDFLANIIPIEPYVYKGAGNEPVL